MSMTPFPTTNNPLEELFHDISGEGDFVEISGLEKSKHLNGAKGLVRGSETTAQDGRLTVQLTRTNQCIRVHPANLRYHHEVPRHLPAPPLPGTAYGNISREDLLPSATKIPFPSDTLDSVKSAFTKIYKFEDCQIYFRMNHTSQRTFIGFQVCLGDDNALQVFGSLFGVAASDSDSSEGGICFNEFSMDGCWSKKSASSLHPELKEELALRVWHHCVRRTGPYLPNEAVLRVTRRLRAQLTFSKRKWDILDVLLVEADAYLLSDNKKAFPHQMFLVAEHLEACGRFDQAAPLYLQVGSSDCYKNDLDEHKTAHTNAALAYKRAEMYAQSEKHNIIAIHYGVTGTKNWETNHSNTVVSIGNLVSMYNDWTHQTSRGQIAGDVFSETERVYMTFYSLLRYAGWDPYNGRVGIEWDDFMKNHVLPKYRPRSAARQALIHAFTEPD